MPRFKPPTPEETQRALGPLESLPANLVRALTDAAASRGCRSSAGEWLAEFPEPGESLKQYERKWAKCTPHAYFTTLYIVPVGTFEPAYLEQLRTYAAAFFCCEVKVAPGVALADVRQRARTGAEDQPQLHADDIFAVMRRKPPRDAFAQVTMEDLYHKEEWNFVFGLAVAADAVGVFSFARYHTAPSARRRRRSAPRSGACCCFVVPRLPRDRARDGPRALHPRALPDERQQQPGESDTHPLNLCPVCLRKLYAAVGFDATARYEAIRRAATALGFDEHARWIGERLGEKCEPCDERAACA